MAIGSYEAPRIQSQKIFQSPTSKTWDLWLELSDHGTESLRTEQLIIRTRVSEPLPDHPQGLELAALLHVRDLLTDRIEKMQSP